VILIAKIVCSPIAIVYISSYYFINMIHATDKMFILLMLDVFISMFDLFLHSRITPKCGFHLTYSCTCLSMQVHDLAKDEWLLFIE
jgi:hypothetical protein